MTLQVPGEEPLSDGNTNLIGNEFSGTIRFNGTFNSLTFSTNPAENWHGFTYGIRTTERIEPTVPEPSTVFLVAMSALITPTSVRVFG